MRDGGTGTKSRQTVVFATQGLGAEIRATEAAVKEFEGKNPDITIKLLVLSGNADRAYQQLTERFRAGTGVPDLATLDVIWPATLARAGWLADLSRFRPSTLNFVPAQVQAATYDGRLYGIPWFINAEGLYYRTDLVPHPPTTPAELVAAAKAAMRRDPSLTDGLTFEGDRYEGAVTVLVNVLGGFGGELNPARMDSPANRQALRFLYELVHRYRVTRPEVVGWQEAQVESAFLSGRAPFAVSWPYLFHLAEQDGSRVQGKTGLVPFPSNGKPAAAMGGSVLAISAKSKHQDAAWRLIQFLTTDAVQIERAVTAGDPPAVPSAYNEQLYATAPYFRQEKNVLQYVTPRPASPAYPQISRELQSMLYAVLTNRQSPEEALSQTAPRVAGLG
jgi:multiple sugar transport system substrate-binding protein